MILVRLMGGLGNQMFQYAAAKALALRNNSTVKIDLTLLENNKKREHEIYTHRDLDLEMFNLKIERATQGEIEYFNGKAYKNYIGKAFNKLIFASRKKNLIIEKGRCFDASIIKLSDNKCLVGSWQSELYFKDAEKEIRKDFTFRNPIMSASLTLLAKIKERKGVCVNVRRGDYITSPIYSKSIGALPAEYYNEGISLMENKIKDPVCFVFSDDVEWCKKNLRSKSSMEFVGHEHAGKSFSNYLQLMTACTHFVISNSTFSWWSAYLGRKKESAIIAPKNWARAKESFPANIIPSEWITLENTFEKLPE